MFCEFWSRLVSPPMRNAGSHVKVRLLLPSGTHESLTVPLHREVDRGTLMAIYRQACRFISEQELRDHFFSLTFIVAATIDALRPGDRRGFPAVSATP